MKKLSLDLADLRIESFQTAPAERTAGTVRGHIPVWSEGAYDSNCCEDTQADTCADSCGCTVGYSCPYSCICPSHHATACGLAGTCGCLPWTEAYQESCFCWN
ncbi:MAG TPA: hypothetical protein VF092_10055 [Longimicrobium sp.]